MTIFPSLLRNSLCIGTVSCLLTATAQAGYVIVEGFSGHAINGDASSPNIDVITRGELVYAYNGGGVGVVKPVTINGVTFETASGAVGSGTQTYGSITCTPSANNFGSAKPGTVTGYVPAGGDAAGALSSDYCELLQGGLAVNGSAGPAVTLTLNNLEVGHTYLLQIWFNDSRTDKGSTNSSIRFLDQASSEAFEVSRNNGASNHYLGSYATVAFTVDSTSQSFMLSNGSYVMFNALQVRDITSTIPESSTVTLAGLALLGMAARRKR